MDKQEYQEIGDPVTKDVNEKVEKTEEDKLINVSTDDEEKEKPMPSFIAQEAKKADVGFYVFQVLLCLIGGAFAAYVGSNHVASECAQPVAIWLQILGGTIAAIGVLWWAALFGLKRIRKIKIRMWVNRIFGALLVLSGIFFIVWLAIGHYWVFQTSKVDCNPGLYLTGLWFIIGIYIDIIAMLCLQCSVAMCLVCCAVFRSQSKEEDPSIQASEPLHEKDPENPIEEQENPEKIN